MKRSKTALLFIVSIAFLNGVKAQSKEPTAEHNKLSALVGRWTLKGMEDRVLEICEMYPGSYFLVCNSEIKTKSGGLSKGVSIMGYSTEGKYHTYYHYGSNGNSQTLKGRIDEEGSLFFEGEEMIGGELIKTRVAMKKAGDHYNFKEEISKDGGPWTTSTEIVYVRAK